MLEAKHTHTAAATHTSAWPAPTRRALLVGAGVTLAAPSTKAATARPAPDDEALLATLAAFEACERKIIALYQRGNAAFIEDDDERDAARTPIEDEQAPFVEPVCAIRAHTPAAVLARARALLLWDQDLAARVAGTSPCGSSIGERMTEALLRDLLTAVA